MAYASPATSFRYTFHNRMTIWLIAACFTAFGIWAYNAVLDEVVRGSGKVVPSSRTQVIQSLEGGILKEVHAWEGQIVPKGAVLARLDDTKFEGSLDELNGQITALEAKLLRLQRELEFETVLDLPAELERQSPGVVSAEKQLFQARLQEYQSSIQAFEATMVLQNREVAMLANLSASNLVPELDLVRAEKLLAEMEAEREAYLADYSLARAEEFATSQSELKRLKANLETRQDQLSRTNLHAPVRGIVNKLSITTIGGVVAPGDAILELTPLDDELRIEAKILPKDIAFVTPNMPATVKLTAYDYTIFGSLSGKVVHISADTFEDESHDGSPYYKVLIEVSAETLEGRGEAIEIRPGMLADAELQVGNKTVLQYLLKPLFKTTDAFREP